MDMATDLSSQIASTLSKLKASNTAFSPNVAPSARDLALDSSLRKLQKTSATEKSNAIKADIYGPGGASEDPVDLTGGQSNLTKLLKGLNAPMAIGAGALEHLLGLGSKKTLLGNVAANVDERGTYGDILRGLGLPNIIAAPAGLLADIGGDPLNWATAGTAALVPRIGVGAVKGGLEGAAAGLKSGGLMKAEGLLRMVPGASKAAEAGAEKGVAGVLKRTAEKAVASRENYERLTGTGLDEFLSKTPDTFRVGGELEKWLQKSELGKQTLSKFKYSADDWFDAALRKSPEEAAKMEEFLKTSNKANPFARPIAEAETIASSPPSAFAAQNTDEMLARAAREAEDEKLFKAAVGHGFLRESDDLAALGEAEKAFLGRQVASAETLFSGVKMADDMFRNIMNTPVGLKALEWYTVLFQGLFKAAKVPGHLVAATVNSVGGNPIFALMAGMNPFTPGYAKAVIDGVKMSFGNEKALARLLEGEMGGMLGKYFKQNPQMADSILGLEGRMAVGYDEFLDDMASKIAVANVNSGKDASASFKGIEVLKQVARDTYGAERLEKAARKKGFSTIDATLNPERATPTFQSSEYMRGTYANFVNEVKRLAATEKNEALKTFYKSAEWYLTKPGELYNKSDQSFRIGTLIHLLHNGLSYRELKQMAPRFSITADDLVQVAGQNVWRVKPDKALRIVNEIFLNYLAMPAAVKFLRVVPIIGAPFASFSYGATDAALKALRYNPAVFNKVQNALHEITGEKTPLEKQALQGKYSSFVAKTEGMTKLPYWPFWQDNPVYANLANMLSYYTLNAFQPIQRQYGSGAGDKAMKFIDTSPFFKEPIGQLMLNYFLTPTLMGEAQGQFGQALYGKNAGVPEVAGKLLRDTIETIVPTDLGFAGLAGPLLPESMLPYVPSFRFRQLANALEGKTSEGVISKTEPSTERVIRTLSAMLGLPVYTVRAQLNSKK